MKQRLCYHTLAYLVFFCDFYVPRVKQETAKHRGKRKTSHHHHQLRFLFAPAEQKRQQRHKRYSVEPTRGPQAQFSKPKA